MVAGERTSSCTPCSDCVVYQLPFVQLHSLFSIASLLVCQSALLPCLLSCCSYLLPDTKTKQKTSHLNSTGSPQWNQTLVFCGTAESASGLSDRILEVTVWDHGQKGSSSFIGGLHLGMDSNCQANEESHWEELLVHKVGEWVEKRHILRQIAHR